MPTDRATEMATFLRRSRDRIAAEPASDASKKAGKAGNKPLHAKNRHTDASGLPPPAPAPDRSKWLAELEQVTALVVGEVGCHAPPPPPVTPPSLYEIDP